MQLADNQRSGDLECVSASGRALARIAGSNLTGGMDIFTLWMSGRDLCTGPSSVLEESYRVPCVRIGS